MGGIIRQYGERILSALAVLWIGRHQRQFFDPYDQLTIATTLVILVAFVAYLEERTALLNQDEYHLLRSFASTLLYLIGFALSWMLVGVVSDFYGNSLDPFLSLETSYRTVALVLLVVAGMAFYTFLEESRSAAAKRMEEEKHE